MATRKRLQRKEMVQPDPIAQFLHRIVDSIAPYYRQIGIGILVVTVTATVAWAVQFQKQQTEAALGADVANATQKYTELLEAHVTGQDPEWSELQATLEELYDRTDGTRHEIAVRYYLFHVFLEQGNLEAATSVLGELQAKVADQPRMLATMTYSLAKVKEVKGDINGAVETMKEAATIVPNPLGEFLNEEIKRLSGGRLNPALVQRFAPKTQPKTGEAGDTATQ